MIFLIQIKFLSAMLFADDTTVVYSHEDKSVLWKTVNRKRKEFSNWCKANKLSLNIGVLSKVNGFIPTKMQCINYFASLFCLTELWYIIMGKYKEALYQHMSPI